MSRSVVADFTTEVIPDTAAFDEPVRGRVLMNETTVVIATAETKRSIRIADIFDIAYGSAPAELRRFFEDTVTIAYDNGNGRHVALIEGADETVGRFTDLLFKAVLNGTEGLVKHPARVGGRVTDAEVRPMTIALQPGRVAFNGQESVSVEVSTVSNFERIHREFRGTDQPVLSVTHAPEMQSMTTQVALEADRKMNILGRFLRTEYSQLQEELADLDVSDREAEAMVGLYSGGDDASLASMLGMESNQVTMLLNGLLEKGLLEEHAEGMALTSLGKLAVSSKIEQVNM